MTMGVLEKVFWRQNRIPNAQHVTFVSLKKQLAMLRIYPERPLVAICLSAQGSIPAVRLLKHHGLADVCQIKGG